MRIATSLSTSRSTESMSTESDLLQTSQNEVVCPKCLLANAATAAFCADCGAPIGMVAAIDPIQQIQAEGFAYRSAVEGPPKLIIVVGMWLLFGPIVLAWPFVLSSGFGSSPAGIFFTLLSV